MIIPNTLTFNKTVSSQGMISVKDVVLTIQIKKIEIESIPLPSPCPLNYSEKEIEIAKQSENPEDVFKLGLFLLSEEDFDKALFWLEKAAKLESDKRAEYIEFKEQLKDIFFLYAVSQSIESNSQPIKEAVDSHPTASEVISSWGSNDN